MTNRWHIKCSICDSKITLRVAIGTRHSQSHSFSCPICKGNIKFTFSVRFTKKRPGFEFFDYKLKNCEFVRSTAPQLEHVYVLHPEFPLPTAEITSSMFNANIYLMQQLGDQLSPNEMNGVANGDTLKRSWDDILINWNLFENKQWKLLGKRLKPFKMPNGNLSRSSESFLDQLFSYVNAIHTNGGADTIHSDIVESVKLVRRDYPQNLKSFLEFHQKILFPQNMKLYRKALTSYMEGFSDFMQVRLPMKINMNLDGHIVTSIDFERTEKVYGILFETITKAFSTVGLFSKMLNGGTFDSFQKISLQDYLDSSIQNKLNALPQDIPESYKLHPMVTDNDLRNASHHQSMHLELADLKLVCQQREGKSFELQYIDYLVRCCESLNAIAGLMSIDMVLHMESISNES